MREIYELLDDFFLDIKNENRFFINFDLIVCLWREFGKINCSLILGYVLIIIDWNRIREIVLKREDIYLFFLLEKKMCNMFD